MRWYRAYVGTTTDKKLGAIALRAGVSRSVVVAAWHVILESAADANAGGEAKCDEFYVSAALGEPLDAIQRVMVCFAEADMFRDGLVTAWQRRQYESDSSAERTKQWRDRNKPAPRRPCDVTVTPPDTEADTDSERKHSAREKSRKRQSVALPDDWNPSDAAKKAATELGFSETEMGREAEKFCWHAKQNDRRVVDWDSAFRNWLIKGADMAGKKPKSEVEAVFKAMPHSAEFLAWKAHARDSGQKGFIKLLEQRELEGRAFGFETRWPPGHKEAA